MAGKVTKKTGTKEWSDFSYNIGNGCAHDCIFCYARIGQVARYKRISPENWPIESLKSKATVISGDPTKKVAMFPTTHDITPGYLPSIIEGIQKLIARGKDVLLVSKPHLECIKKICTEFADCKNRIQFRFTIGTLNKSIAAFWEPGAPAPDERVQCLKHALKAGFKVTVSMEPMLSDTQDAIKTFSALAQIPGLEEIWIGKMNYIGFIELRGRQEVMAGNSRGNEILAMCAKNRIDQADPNILKMVDTIGISNWQVRWKDSIRNALEKACKTIPQPNPAPMKKAA
jgi:hypothetical protein